MAAFTARYPGECTDCCARVEVGDLITHGDSQGEYAHAEACTPDRVDVVETVCPTCFLTVCDCGKDV